MRSGQVDISGWWEGVWWGGGMAITRFVIVDITSKAVYRLGYIDRGR